MTSGHRFNIFAVFLLLLLSLPAAAADVQLAACAAVADDRARLACYDALVRGEGTPAPEPPAPPAARPLPEPLAPAPSELEKRWQLRPELKQGTLTLLPYKPIYLLFHSTSAVNDSPQSPTRSAPAAQGIQLDRAEAKTQLSFRTKVAEDVLGSAADLWLAYTQQSYWQAGNSRYSSPFRETDYEPEAILIQPLHFSLGGIHARYVGLSLNHQSNGRGESLSRSWNRLIPELALESGLWSFQLRSWTRVFEATGENDDNPDIEDFVGRGELIAVRRNGRHVLTLTGRHTLKPGSRSRGSAQLDWSFPLAGTVNGHLQIFTGYGENLRDYNHRQTTIGLGVSFFD